MRLHYLVAAHNEEGLIDSACNRILPLRNRFPGIRIYLLENGSTDRTWSQCLKLQDSEPNVIRALRTDRAGLGGAFRMGLDALNLNNITKDDWIVLAAADLPFGFSDLDSVISALDKDRDNDVWVYVGSKAHPLSQIERKWNRSAATYAFYLLRKLILGLKTKDTQGSLFIRGDVVDQLRQFKSHDFFFAVEIISQAEIKGTVKEVPVILEPESRPSKVRLARDGFRLLKQLLIYSFNR